MVTFVVDKYLCPETIAPNNACAAQRPPLALCVASAFHLTRQIKERFDAEGISFPFPQRDVHIDSVAVKAEEQFLLKQD